MPTATAGEDDFGISSDDLWQSIATDSQHLDRLIEKEDKYFPDFAICTRFQRTQ